MKRIIIDCDPGIDDAMAIMMAYMHPETEIEAITTVSGNTNVTQATVNVLKVLDVLDAKSIPVFSGAGSALLGNTNDASFVHGFDGLGDLNLAESKRAVKSDPASMALINLAKEKPGELSLIAIGPLTNLALALNIDPELPCYYKELVVMGGAYQGKGNTENSPAEFNIFSDPEAASIVFKKWPMLTLVTWEATLDHGLPEDFMDKIKHYDNPRRVFLEKVMNKVMGFMKQHFNTNICYTADPLAMAVMIEPEIILESIEAFARVELSGMYTRGMTVVDWFGVSQKSPNVRIIKQVDMERFIELMISIVQ